MSFNRGSRRGVGLVEFLIVCAIITLILVVVVSIMNVGQRTQIETQGLASLTGEMLSTARSLREDLKATSIGSIAVFETQPSMSMATFGEREQTTQFAAPNWKGHIFYTLSKHPKGIPGAAQLIRWENRAAKPFLYPKASLLKPWEIPDGATKRVVTKMLVNKGWSVENQGRGFALKEDAESNGGFVPRFVRLAPNGSTELSEKNPTSVTDFQQTDWSNGSTSLVSVTLKVLELRGSRVSTIDFEVKAQPRN
jgi:hypothetical protein